MNGPLQRSAPCLWFEATPDTFRRVRDGEVVARFWSVAGPIKVPKGLIHDWVGSALIPGSSVAELLALIQDYDNHRNIYGPEVIDSKLLSRRGDDFRIYLRLLKKKVITVVLDTEHECSNERGGSASHTPHASWRCRMQAAPRRRSCHPILVTVSFGACTPTGD